MNYRITIELSVDNDETEQEPPTSGEIIQAVYDGRVLPEGIFFDLKEIQVERF